MKIYQIFFLCLLTLARTPLQALDVTPLTQSLGDLKTKLVELKTTLWKTKEALSQKKLTTTAVIEDYVKKIKEKIKTDDDMSEKFKTQVISLKLTAANFTDLNLTQIKEVLTKVFSSTEGKKITFLHIEEIDQLETIDISATKNLQMLSIERCKKLTDINIPSGLANLKILMITKNESLNKVTFPSTQYSLRRLAIEKNKALKTILNLKKLTLLRTLSLIGNTSLKRIHLPISSSNSLKIIDLAGCTALEHITGLSSLEKIEKLYLEQCSKLNLITYQKLLNELNKKNNNLLFYLQGTKFQDPSGENSKRLPEPPEDEANLSSIFFQKFGDDSDGDDFNPLPDSSDDDDDDENKPLPDPPEDDDENKLSQAK